MNSKAKIYNFLNQNKYMTLATSDKNGKPEAATVEYVLDGDSLLVNTYTYYRKYNNLTTNPQVACVVTEDHEMTLQFDAKATLLTGDDAKKAKIKMLKAEPDFSNFFNDADTRFFRIEPYWLRLRNYTKEPMEEVELKQEAINE